MRKNEVSRAILLSDFNFLISLHIPEFELLKYHLKFNHCYVKDGIVDELGKLNFRTNRICTIFC